MILRHPALRLLALLKLRGALRRQARRVRSASGLAFMLVGLGLMGLWMASILIAPGVSRGVALEPERARGVAQVALFFLALVSVTGALSVRGLYLPKNEVERMFSAPVSRADLVRFRMVVDAGRSLVGGVVLAILAHRHLPHPVYGFAGAFLSVLTLSVVRQTASLVFGDAHGRIGRTLVGRKLLGVRVLIGVLLWLGFLVLIFGERFLSHLPGPERWWDALPELLAHPAAQAMLLPFRPWAEMMTAESAREFVPWTAACALLWLGLFELTARLPIDYREVSLQTSEEIARRLRTVRGGGPFGAGRISDAAAGRRIPWLFGRGPLGAVAWIKLSAILRKARGTLLVALIVVGVVTAAISYVALGTPLEGQEDGAGAGALLAPALIGMIGLLYLCGAVRFDFRADLERMESIKSWPVGPRRLFLAALLPEVLLISGLIAAAIVTRALVLESFHPGLALVLLALPPVALAWIAVDNAVFLFAPVRFVPGQEGTLHHTGRAMVLLFARFLVFGAGSLLVAGAAVGTRLLADRALALPPRTATGLAVAAGALALLSLDATLVALGGALLRRFDVARDAG